MNEIIESQVNESTGKLIDVCTYKQPIWFSILQHPFLWIKWKITARRVLSIPGNQYVSFLAYLKGGR